MHKLANITERNRAGFFATLVGGVGVALVFGAIWGPWVAYYYLPEPRIAPEVIAEARRVPDDVLLRELGSYDLYPPLTWTSEDQLVKAAEGLLVGRVDLPGFPVAKFAVPLVPSEMATGPTTLQLFVYAFGLPRVLVDAYKASGRPEFLDAAAEYLVAFDDYERAAWQPGGYLWHDTWRRFARNDHAVASRVPVLTDFWRVYRQSPNYRPDVASAVFRIVARAADLLTDPAQFTVATNHGVMQNLAACNAELAFPTLPGVEGLCQLAFTRLGEQLAFFINDEGFVLEHSPGYQSFSLRLIGIALRQLTLSRIEIPESWLRKYYAAQRVYADLRRPDGTLPVFGDTDGGSDGAGPPTVVVDDHGHASPPVARDWSPGNQLLIAPVAGYALWWDGPDAGPDARDTTQTAVAWSNFPGMGHKHADEMSLAVWARGTSWWGNVGYWPYEPVGRRLAESWAGSNAPHLVGEREGDMRETRLRYYGRDDNLVVVDVERRGPGDYQARRQVVQVGNRVWVVIDTTSSGINESRTRTIWTTSPTVQMTEREADGEFTLTDRRSGQSLRAFFLGAPGTSRSLIEGSLNPFGGWLVVDYVPQPAPAVVVDRPADGSWQLVSWSLADNAGNTPLSEIGLAGPPHMQRWVGVDDWQVLLPTATGTVSITRSGGRIDMMSGAEPAESLQLNLGENVSKATVDLRAALEASSAKYGAADMSGVYRLKVTVVLLAALLLNVTVLRFARRISQKWAKRLRILLSATWLLLGYYLVFVRAQLM